METLIDWAEYRRCNPDLSAMSDVDAERHYMMHGKGEGRCVGQTMKVFCGTTLPKWFSVSGYVRYNKLACVGLSDDEAVARFVANGMRETFTTQLLHFPLYHEIDDELLSYLLSVTQDVQGGYIATINETFAQRFEQPRLRELHGEPTVAQPNASAPVRSKNQPGRDIAIVLHLGTRCSTIDEFVHLNEATKRSKHVSDLFITVCDDNTERAAKLAFLSSRTQRVLVMRVPNRGLDIGPFLHVLEHIAKAGVPYKVFFKWHAKGNVLVRQLAHSPFQNPISVHRTFARLICTRNNVGMVCYQKGGSEWTARNLPWIQLITAQLREKPFLDAEQTFAMATIFACRASVMMNRVDALVKLSKYCNDATSIDWAWYCTQVGVPPSPANAKLLTATHGFDLLFPYARGHAYSDPFNYVQPQDGMFEHAMERIFGFIVARDGLIIHSTMSP